MRFDLKCDLKQIFKFGNHDDFDGSRSLLVDFRTHSPFSLQRFTVPGCVELGRAIPGFVHSYSVLCGGVEREGPLAQIFRCAAGMARAYVPIIVDPGFLVTGPWAYLYRYR